MPSEVHASPRDEALFHCAEPSRVPRGPANYTASLTSQRHPGKFPKVPGRRRGSSSGGTKGLLASRVSGVQSWGPSREGLAAALGQGCWTGRTPGHSSSPKTWGDQSCRWTMTEVEKRAFFICPYFVCVCIYIFALWHFQCARQSEAFSRADLCQSLLGLCGKPAMSDSGCELSQMSYGRTWDAGGAVEPRLWLEIVHGCT